jgi:tripartite-type tricarboxylate transporter receptor subunit TctC
MKLRRRDVLSLAARGGIAGLSAAVPSWSTARAQARTIKVVVPFPPGGIPDALVRLLNDHISRAHGVTLITENRPGAATAIGTEAVARAMPDGNTLLLHANAFVFGPHLRKLNFDPRTSFEPICYLVRLPPVIIVANSSPYRTLAELLNAARAKPGELTMAGTGPATSFHISVEMLKRAAQANLTFVPFPGSPPAINALLGGHVTSVITNYGDAVEQFKSGKVRVLATTSVKRIESLPDVPTLAEAGFKDFDMDTWFGLAAPARTPKEIVAQTADWFAGALRSPELKPKLAAYETYPVAWCGDEYVNFIKQQYDELGRFIRDSNIRPE